MVYLIDFTTTAEKEFHTIFLQMLQSNTKVEITFYVIRDLQLTILQITTTHL